MEVAGRRSALRRLKASIVPLVPHCICNAQGVLYQKAKPLRDKELLKPLQGGTHSFGLATVSILGQAVVAARDSDVEIICREECRV